MEHKLCWICGTNPADSREHLIKASDIRRFFGKFSQADPIFFQGNEVKNVRIGSHKSMLLKMDKVICHTCNTNVTAPHDKAWESFSKHIGDNWSEVLRSRRIDLKAVFPGSSRNNATNLQLFFAKSFGCRIACDNVPIDLTGFAQSIRSGNADPNLHLGFRYGSFGASDVGYVGLSEIHALKDDDGPVAATSYYTLGDFSVQIFWSHSRFVGTKPANLWHPTQRSKNIKFFELRD